MKVSVKDGFDDPKPVRVALSGGGKPAAPAGSGAETASMVAAAKTFGKVSPSTGATSPTVTTDPSGRTVVDLGAGSNEASVSQLPDGRVQVVSDGHAVTLTEAQSEHVTIQGGDSDDEIEIGGSVTADVRVEGGAGNDTLRGGDGNDTLVGGSGDDTVTGGKGTDSVSGGEGDDYVEGGAGDDTVAGGAGRDTLYGLDGTDVMYGGAEQDYVDGGQGSDRIYGGGGNDALFGGRDGDSISGGSGDDVIAGGHGIDTTTGGGGADTTYFQRNDVIRGAEAADTSEVVDLNTPDGTPPGSSITVEGDDAFQARVESDLEALRSIPTGREMLTELDESGKTVTIKEQVPNDGNKASPENGDDANLQADGTPGPGTNATILYHPERTVLGGGPGEEWAVRPPVVGLFHEMVHAYNYVTGTRPAGTTHQDAHGSHGEKDINNSERVAVGLPYDHDGDPSTPMITADHINENELREELGLPPRPHY